jgi:hypothetical protein
MGCRTCARGPRATGPHSPDCTPELRFWRKVKIMPNGCWEWQGATNGRGYGVIRLAKRIKVYAHRFAYEKTEGPIPEGLVAMHRCDNPLCVRPVHLTPGTQKENVQDMIAKGRRPYRAKNHCKNGHPYTPENTLYHVNGYRRCRECTNAPRRKANRQEASHAA